MKLAHAWILVLHRQQLEKFSWFNATFHISVSNVRLSFTIIYSIFIMFMRIWIFPHNERQPREEEKPTTQILNDAWTLFPTINIIMESCVSINFRFFAFHLFAGFVFCNSDSRMQKIPSLRSIATVLNDYIGRGRKWKLKKKKKRLRSIPVQFSVQLKHWSALASSVGVLFCIASLKLRS